MLKTRVRVTFFVGSFILTLLLATLVLRSGNRNPAAPAQKVLLKEGFDFRQLRSLNPGAAGPGLGTKMDLAALRNTKRERLSSLVNQELLLFAVVDPDCAACDASKSMMQSIRRTTSELGIKYLPVIIARPPPNFDAQKYAAALGFETCVQWSDESPAPKALSELVTPSHILTNKDGVILQVWPGSNNNVEVRGRMSGQISSDLFLISDVLKAAGLNSTSAKP